MPAELFHWLEIMFLGANIDAIATAECFEIPVFLGVRRYNKLYDDRLFPSNSLCVLILNTDKALRR